MTDALPENPDISIIEYGPVTCLTLGATSRKIDYGVNERIGADVVRVAETINSPLLLVDLSEVEYFSSAFLSTLFQAWRKLRIQPGGRFGLCGLTEYARSVITTSHLEEIWELFDDRDAAIRAWGASE